MKKCAILAFNNIQLIYNVKFDFIYFFSLINKLCEPHMDNLKEKLLSLGYNEYEVDITQVAMQVGMQEGMQEANLSCARKLANIGWSDKEIADFLEVSEEEFSNIKNQLSSPNQ
ncbi:MAG: hypothetical protein LBS60_08030 [Deltaproteobacteria bacterium]|nr:hypothetical protein [Deltaproteobacteria bacterium]